MIARWVLPTDAVIAGKKYQIHTDFRDILEIFAYFSDPDSPDYLKWEIALALFFEGDIPQEDRLEAMEYLSWFLAGGKKETAAPGPKLLDWEQDADLIAADINKTAGREVRAMPFLHWWTFLSWFNAIGEGQLSTVVSIRSKLAKGKKLEAWEKEFYREHSCVVELPKRYSRQEREEKARLERMLNN